MKNHPQWKKEIGFFTEVNPYQHISKSCFFNDMFVDFLRGPYDSEGTVSDIKKIKADFVAIASNSSKQEV